MEKTNYSSKFFEGLKDKKSAEIIVPIILKLIKKPKNVIDVGCGLGSFLSVFKKYGIDILGIDGNYVDKNSLLIPKKNFHSFDLEIPFTFKEKFDLVVSLEVAEHLEKEYAKTFVNSLTSLGSVIIFSGAIPYQGGTHHVNEQWLDYWIDLFDKKGYVFIDCFRKRLWEKDVDYYYAQNMVMFVKYDYMISSRVLRREYRETNLNQIRLVHPKRYLMIAKDKELITKFIPNFVKIIIRRIRR